MYLRGYNNGFEENVLPHLDMVYRTALALCGSSENAEDIAQCSILRALERFETFTPGTNSKAWLLQIVRNIWRDQLRLQKRRGNVLPIDEEMITEEKTESKVVWTDAQELLEKFSDEQVIKALSHLPDDQRLTLFLIDVEQFSQDEVAEITGVSVGTVKSRTSRARSALKDRLFFYATEMGLRRGER